MERIASFCVDHTKLDRGMYLSRQDGDVLTWDIRMKKPNHGDYLSTGVGIGPDGAALANATGKACVCHTLEEIRAKFKPGMVLVVPSTSNEMLSYVRDAAALVVEEPGLNSHAAIAGKALLKPTVVGAAGATSHIRDGLMVAVDCAHGSVQRLQA